MGLNNFSNIDEDAFLPYFFRSNIRYSELVSEELVCDIV